MSSEPISLPLGVAVPTARGEADAHLITAVEQVTGGDTLITFANATIFRSGEMGRYSSSRAVRLTAEEREYLIRLLSDHRFAEMTAEFGTEH